MAVNDRIATARPGDQEIVEMLDRSRDPLFRYRLVDPQGFDFGLRRH